MTSSVTAKKLGVSFSGKTILHNIDLSIKKGEFVSIVGKSGVGKSTLLHAIAGLIPIIGTSTTKDVSMVFQKSSVFPWLTVENNIRKTSTCSTHACDTYLAIAGLTDHKKKYPSQLSGGEQQRLALISALAQKKSVILLDEPFGSLDAITREHLQFWLTQLHEKEQSTILLVTHSIEEAIFLSDRVLILTREGLSEIPIPFPRPRNTNIRFFETFLHLKKNILLRLDG